MWNSLPVDKYPVTPSTDLFQRVAALAADFATRAAIHDRDGSFPFENFAALQQAQLLNLTVPKEFGGQGLGYAAVSRVIETIASGDAATALVLTMHYLQHINAARSRRWPATIYERLCRESVEGIALLNAARVEPELGTPARGGLPATTAEHTANGWLLNGHKQYTTGSPILRYFIVWAKTTEAEPRVGNFLVPRHLPGICIEETWDHMGMRATGSHEETWDHMGMRATGSHDLILKNVLIPCDYALDIRPLTAWPSPHPLQLAGVSLWLSALYQGVAKAARDWLVGYLNERSPTNLGASLATLPRFQTVVGEIEALLYASDRLIYGLANDIDIC